MNFKQLITFIIFISCTTLLFSDIPSSINQINSTITQGSWYHQPLQKARKQWQINFFKNKSYISKESITAHSGKPIIVKGNWNIDQVEGNTKKEFYLRLTENHPLIMHK